MSHILVVRTSDWEELYCDGECLMDGHSLDLVNVLTRLLGETIDKISQEYYGPGNRLYDTFPEDEKWEGFPLFELLCLRKHFGVEVLDGVENVREEDLQKAKDDEFYNQMIGE